MKPMEKRLLKLEAEAPDDDDVTKLSGAELRRRIEEIQSNFVRAERDLASAKGEDISQLDDMDFYIRFLRRAHADHPACGWGTRLAGLVREEVPDADRKHYGRCDCATCESGETHPIKSGPLLKVLRQSWLKRYMPEAIDHE